MKIDTNKLPIKILEIFRIFNAQKPDSIRLVGGCVRDFLLGKEVSDYDFACQFTPDQSSQIITNAGFRAIPTGEKYGTITALINNSSFEITTLRSDQNTNGRHPEAQFIQDYFQDAKRRDFTINALYLSQNGQIHDYFNGIEDLKNHQVKFIGDPNQRITEDYLRILRFFRFSAIYSNQLNQEGLQACLNNKSGLEILSSDRIRSELVKFFNSKNPKFLLEILSLIEKSTIRQELIPTKFNIEKLKQILQLENILQTKIPTKLKLFCLIFTDQDLNQTFSKLNLSNSDKKHYYNLFVNIEKNPQQLTNKDLQNLIIHLDRELLRNFYLFQASQNDNPNQTQILQNLEFINNFEIPIFPVNGDDLIELGFEGVKIGETLTNLKQKWIESEFKMSREELLSTV